MAQRGVNSKLTTSGAVLMALALGGCSGATDVFNTDAKWFSKPVTSLLSREDGSGTMGTRNFSLGPTDPVPPEELVNADGSCAVSTEAPATPAAQPAAGSGDAAVQPVAASDSPSVLGGISLGMTECQAVRRAGTPANVSIGAGDNNERRVVLTYLSGQWPGIYTFSGGRLKVVEATPEQEKPAKPVAKKKKPVTKRG